MKQVQGVDEVETHPSRTTDENAIVEVTMALGMPTASRRDRTRRVERFEIVELANAKGARYVESLQGKDNRHDNLMDEVDGPHEAAVKAVLSHSSADVVLDQDGTMIGQMEVCL